MSLTFRHPTQCYLFRIILVNSIVLLFVILKKCLELEELSILFFAASVVCVCVTIVAHKTEDFYKQKEIHFYSGVLRT